MSVTKLVNGVRALSKKIKGNAKRSSIGLVKRAQKDYYVSIAQMVAAVLSSSHEALQAVLRSEKGRAALAKLIEHVMVDIGSRLNELGNLLETISEDKDFARSVEHMVLTYHQFRHRQSSLCSQERRMEVGVERALHKAKAAKEKWTVSHDAVSCTPFSGRKHHICEETGECVSQTFSAGAKIRLVFAAYPDLPSTPPVGAIGTILRVTWISPDILKRARKGEYHEHHPFSVAYRLMPNPTDCFLLEVEWDKGCSGTDFLLTSIDEVEVLGEIGPPWDKVQEIIKARLDSGDYNAISLSEYHEARKPQ